LENVTSPGSLLSKEPLPAPLLNDRLCLCDQLGSMGLGVLIGEHDDLTMRERVNLQPSGSELMLDHRDRSLPR
jgi:hypothetical protein